MKIIDDGKALFESENVYASMVGMVVDYLTRFVTGTSIEVTELILYIPTSSYSYRYKPFTSNSI